MTNRTMQQKALKLRRQRRAWARPLLIRSGIRPNAEVISGYKQSAKGLALSDQELDALVYMLFGTQHKGISPPRKAVADTLLSIEKDDISDFFYRTILDNQYQRVRAYHNGTETNWTVVHENFSQNYIRRSIIYGSLKICKVRWEQKRLSWTFVRDLPSPSLDLVPTL